MSLFIGTSLFRAQGLNLHFSSAFKDLKEQRKIIKRTKKIKIINSLYVKFIKVTDLYDVFVYVY